MTKKVIFISLWDVISIPSKEEKPTDVTDYQLDYNFIKALKAMDDTIRVNLFACINKVALDEVSFKKMLSAISYAISIYTEKAVLPYYSLGSKPKKPLEDAMSDTSKISILSDKGDWLIIGGKDLADNTEIDFMGIKEFCDGGIEENTEGTEG